MKKIIFLFVLLFLTLFATFASNTLEFSGRYALIGANGRTIRRNTVNIEKSGVIVATGDEKAYIKNDLLDLELEEDSLITISQKDGKVTLYLVYGSLSLISKSQSTLEIYTSTTKTTIDGECEVYSISTDNEEKIYNFSLSSYSLYDGIRGTTTTLNSNMGYDYIKAAKVSLDETKRRGESIAIETPQKEEKEETSVVPVEEKEENMVSTPDKPEVEEPKTALSSPDKPIFEAVVTALTVPNKPEITLLERSLTLPEKPLILEDVTQNLLIDFDPEISVEQTLIDSKDN